MSNQEVNLKPAEFPELGWSEDETPESLAKLSSYVTQEALGAINWYYTKKEPKQRGAQYLRVAAILLVAAAGIIPVLSGMEHSDGTPWLPPEWATIAVALAALMIALDKFWGFSSGWIRFLVAAQELEQHLNGFRFDWEVKKLAWDGDSPNEEQAVAMVEACSSLLEQVKSTVRQETSTWAAEFQSVLRLLEEEAKAVREVRALGGIAVEITNGSEAEDGWTLSVDGGSQRRRRGPTAALRGITPGIHVVRAEGTLSGDLQQAEAAVTVESGTVAQVSLTLA